jgi:hypothetical protein
MSPAPSPCATASPRSSGRIVALHIARHRISPVQTGSRACKIWRIRLITRQQTILGRRQNRLHHREITVIQLRRSKAIKGLHPSTPIRVTSPDSFNFARCVDTRGCLSSVICASSATVSSSCCNLVQHRLRFGFFDCADAGQRRGISRPIKATKPVDTRRRQLN